MNIFKVYFVTHTGFQKRLKTIYNADGNSPNQQKYIKLYFTSPSAPLISIKSVNSWPHMDFLHWKLPNHAENLAKTWSRHVNVFWHTPSFLVLVVLVAIVLLVAEAEEFSSISLILYSNTRGSRFSSSSDSWNACDCSQLTTDRTRNSDQENPNLYPPDHYPTDH